jgi:hypothetical protein
VAFDTTPEAREVQRAVWRRIGPEGRVRIAVEVSEAVKRTTLAGIASRHPELDEAGRMRAYIKLVHGVALDAP